jgi:hypothetical protein
MITVPHTLAVVVHSPYTDNIAMAELAGRSVFLSACS